MAITTGAEIEVRPDDDFLDFTALKSDGTVQDLTGWSLVGTLKWSIWDPDAAAIWTKSTDLGTIVVSSPATGVGYLDLSPADWDGLPFLTRYVLDVRGTDPVGNVSTLSVQVVRLMPVVTRSLA